MPDVITLDARIRTHAEFLYRKKIRALIKALKDEVHDFSVPTLGRSFSYLLGQLEDAIAENARERIGNAAVDDFIKKVDGLSDEIAELRNSVDVVA